MNNTNWIEVGKADSIEIEDLIRFDHAEKTFCVYRLEDGYYATDGMCTHEDEHLESGLVIGTVVECPLHQGRFDIPTGKALGAPVCVNLITYVVKKEDGNIYLNID